MRRFCHIVAALVACASYGALASVASAGVSLDNVTQIGSVDAATDFNVERGLAAAPDGTFYKMDSFHARITHFSATGSVIGAFRMRSPIFGMMFGVNQTQHGNALVVAPDGTIYATPSAGLPIEHYSASGEFLDELGVHGSDPGQIGYASKIAVSSTGRVYVLDWENAHIVEMTSTGQFVANHNAGQIAVDVDDTVWVIDGGCEVRHLNPDWTQIAAFGNCGDFDFVSDLAVDATMVYVARGDSVDRIDRYLKDGTFVDSVSSSGSGDGQLLNPAAIAIVGGSRIAVSDYDRQDMQLLNADGSFHSLVTHPYVGGQFMLPARVAVSDTGTMYASDPLAGTVQKFSASGQFQAMIGSRGGNPGQFNTPAGIMVASDGSLWVVDNQAARVLRFSAAGAYLSSIGTPGSGNGQFQNPAGISKAPDGTFWVIDTGRSDAQHFAADGTYLGKAGITGSPGSSGAHLNRPYGGCVDEEGGLWIADTMNDRIRHFAPTGALLGGFGVLGSAPGQFNHPVEVACIPGGLLLITDSLNHRVQWMTDSGEPVEQFGSFGYSGTDHLALPLGATFANGRTIISDTFNQRLLMLTNDVTPPTIAAGGSWSGSFVSAASGQVPVDIADAQSFVARVVATVDGKRVKFVKGRADLRRVPEGRRTLRIVVTDGAGNERSWSRRIVVDRTAPYPSALRIVTLRDRASITISDNLSGARSDSRAFGGLRLGMNSRRISLGDLAGNTREVTVRLIYRPSIAQPWNNPRHSVYYMPRTKLFATHVRVGLVKEAQRRLKLLGFLNGHAAVNGRMNGPTTRAMRRFQRQQGLTPSGDLNLVTRFALDLAIVRLG